MPTTKRRMALSLPQDLEAALVDLADAVGKPVATVAVELLTELVPQMEGLAKYARAAKAGNQAAAKRALVHMMGDAMAEVMTATQGELPLTDAKKKPGKARSR
jgi:predicted DNA-binding protein